MQTFKPFITDQDTATQRIIRPIASRAVRKQRYAPALGFAKNEFHSQQLQLCVMQVCARLPEVCLQRRNTAIKVS
jgi:hypothetical protein